MLTRVAVNTRPNWARDCLFTQMRHHYRFEANVPTRNEVRNGKTDRFQWDWVTVVLALTIAAIVAGLTFELWMPHDILGSGLDLQHWR